MAYNLPTNVTPGSGGHTALHNQTNVAVNDLDTRTAGLEANSPASIFIPATAFVIVSGAPTLTGAAPVAYPRWLLDPAATEIVNTVMHPPLGWNTAKARLYWSAESTQAGNAMIQFRALPVKVNGELLNTGEGTQSLTLDAPDQSVLAVNDFANPINLATVDPANRPLLQFSIRRIGGDALDTFPADISFIGLSLIKVS
ncbi:hypothetical protein [Pseudarthrobacter polychromogenes]|uniref:Uncharacterized protein n=1 Tax=Pseudarthrobacter polychromogenes TaxID=1676 RepID=A0ABQ1Y389_9MICC|nr:hypothetical protein [Pseudarthrobacter polychromogenes]GGH10547.1 hypothetical protein GCM10011577_39400 [Pseudarthrobacter polychromogenes]